MTSYVLLPDGTITWLSPDYLKELISDNGSLVEELESKKLTPDRVYEMFENIDKYNRTKK